MASWPPGSRSASTRRRARSPRPGSGGSIARSPTCSPRASSFPIRVEPDRFVWAGPEIRTSDPALEAFRFDLESRGIRELEIDAAVEEWELQAFLELLNMPGGELRQLGGASGFLSARNVLRVRVAAPGDGREAEADAGEVTRQALQTGRDAVDLFAETVVGLTEARFEELSYDRAALAAWLQETGASGADRLYAAIRMIHGLVEQAPDREVRTRTLVEALLGLPEELLRPFFAEHLIPLAGRDVLALNLLSQMTEDEIRHVAARLVPQESLLALSSKLLEFPWEEVQRRRLIEAITSAVGADDSAGLLVDEGVVLEADDPLVVELREEILASCQPDVLLDRSAEILLALVLNAEGQEYGTSAADAFEEILAEALTRGRLEFAVQLLTHLGEALQTGGGRTPEHIRQLAGLQERLGGRSYVALLGGVLRQHAGNERQLTLVAQYLGLVARGAVQEFIALLGEERDRQVRARMCQVLAKVGPSIVPTLMGWLEDPRWFLVRNVVHVLGKIGDDAAFNPVVRLLGHPHMRVRIEALRTLALIAPGPRRAADPPAVTGRRPGGSAGGGPGARRASAGRGAAGPARRGGRRGGSGRPVPARGGRRGAGGARDRRGLRGARGVGSAARLALAASRAPPPGDRRRRAGGADGRRGSER